MPGCDPDIWTINHDKILKASHDSVKRCRGGGGGEGGE
jgi:hypothetical protein